MLKLLKNNLKSYLFGLIEFYGIILISMPIFAYWVSTIDNTAQTVSAIKMIYFYCLQLAIFAGLLHRLTESVYNFSVKPRFCLAPIKASDKVIVPVLFFLANFVIADLLAFLYSQMIGIAGPGEIAAELAKVFLLCIFITIIVLLTILITTRLFSKSRLGLPKTVDGKLDEDTFHEASNLILFIAIGAVTVLIGQAAGRFINLPQLTLTYRAPHISNINFALPVETLPYIILGIIYLFFICVLARKEPYAD